MALFFDQEWFDARLKESGSTREDLGRLLRLTPDQVSELWKDQRELRADDVAILARFLNVAATEVAHRAGISTPLPGAASGDDRRLAALERRVEMLEGTVKDLVARLAGRDLK